MRSRLQNAATNGSVVAADVLAELCRNCDAAEVIRGTYNYFRTKRIKANHNSFHKIRIMFTACGKNLSHENFPDKGDPSAQWYNENRADLDPSTFVGLFKNLREYTSEEIKYFISAISLDSRVTVKLCSGVKDIFEAYCEDNYTLIADHGEPSLHSSCMRYGEMARNAADFYHNFAGARLLVAKDRDSNILGRAVVWEGVTWQHADGTETEVSLMDRIYYSHTFIVDLMREAARKEGIIFRKRYNDFSHTREVVTLNPVEGTASGEELSVMLKLVVPVCRWHKRGVPYLDTFHYLMLNGDVLELSNQAGGNIIAGCQSTSGYASRSRNICPRCNRLHSASGERFCGSCLPEVYTTTLFGRVLKGHAVRYRGQQYPSSLFRRGRPIPELRRYLQIERLFNANDNNE